MMCNIIKNDVLYKLNYRTTVDEMRPQKLSMLIVFDAIMAEGSITRAADRLSMSQPAVSNTVAKMRAIWNDEIFIKKGRNIQPTLFATNLWAKIQSPLFELSNAIDPVVFDPTTSTRTFYVGAADVLIDLAWADLRKIIENEAPGINVYARPYTINNGIKLLDDSKVDIAIGVPATMSHESINTELLYHSQFICIMRKGHPLECQLLTLERFLTAEHLLVSLSGDPHGQIDIELMKHGLKRRIAMTVNHFSAITPLLIETDLISVVPSHAVMKGLNDELIGAHKLPLEVDPIAISIFWHKRNQADPGLAWLRKKIHSIIEHRTMSHRKQIDRIFNGSNKNNK